MHKKNRFINKIARLFFFLGALFAFSTIGASNQDNKGKESENLVGDAKDAMQNQPDKDNKQGQAHSDEMESLKIGDKNQRQDNNRLKEENKGLMQAMVSANIQSQNLSESMKLAAKNDLVSLKKALLALNLEDKNNPMEEEPGKDPSYEKIKASKEENDGRMDEDYLKMNLSEKRQAEDAELRFKALDKEANRLKNLILSLQEENEKLQETIHQIKASFEQKPTVDGDIKSEVEQHQKEIGAINKKIAALNNSPHDVLENTILENTILELEKQSINLHIKGLIKHAMDLHNSIEKLEKENKRLTKQIDALKLKQKNQAGGDGKKIANLTKQINALKEGNNKKINEVTNQNAGLNNQINDLQTKNLDLTKQINALKLKPQKKGSKKQTSREKKIIGALLFALGLGIFERFFYKKSSHDGEEFNQEEVE